MVRTLRRRDLSWPAGVMLVLALTAAPLRADVGGAAPDSWSRFVKYAGCALGIAAATTGLGVAVAVIGCIQILIAEV